MKNFGENNKELIAGPRGKSAYDAWKEIYGGSKEEFFAYLKGKKGEKGDKGDKGDSIKGDRGEKGAIGPVGPKGDKGDKGDSIKGDKGDKGDSVQGEKGDKGDKGEKGDKGDKGEQGIQGIQGLIGEKGDEGKRGEIGQQGIKGDKGEKGDQGETGQKGDRGDRGERGLVGPKGDKGDKGDIGLKGNKGDQGEQGPKGEKGDKGDTIEVQVFKIMSSSNQEITSDFNPIVFNQTLIQSPFVKSLTANPIDFKINKTGRYRFTLKVVTADDEDANYIKLKIEANNNKYVYQTNIATDVLDLSVNTSLRFFVAKYLNHKGSVRLQPGQIILIVEQIG